MKHFFGRVLLHYNFVGSLGDFGCYIAAQTIFTNNDIGKKTTWFEGRRRF